MTFYLEEHYLKNWSLKCHLLAIGHVICPPLFEVFRASVCNSTARYLYFDSLINGSNCIRFDLLIDYCYTCLFACAIYCLSKSHHALYSSSIGLASTIANLAWAVSIFTFLSTKSQVLFFAACCLVGLSGIQERCATFALSKSRLSRRDSPPRKSALISIMIRVSRQDTECLLFLTMSRGQGIIVTLKIGNVTMPSS